MHFRFFALIACLILFPSLAPAADNSTPENAILAGINKLRAETGLTPLQSSPDLMTLSAEWARTMADKQTLVHRKDLLDHMHSLKMGSINENIYMTQKEFSAGQVVVAWTNSPGHKKNMLSPGMTLAGVGIAKGANGTTYVTFNSAAPMSPLE
jgi:uncharacterized protein YkwD